VALNKPRGVLSSMSDDRGRRTVTDLVQESGLDIAQRLFHIGRLDADSEGLLLLTNDGDLAHRLMHPSFGVLKTYLATVPGPVARDVGRRLRAGVELEDGPAAVDAFTIVQAHGDRAIVEVVLHEGRNHIVRRMLAEVGHPVSRLVRTRIGPVHLGGQRAGTLRPLRRSEIAELHRLGEPGPAPRDR
jgi:23S rRNA pseudouridine2605 synthase